MNIAPKGARFLPAATAFLVVVGLTGAALAQDLAASPLPEATRTGAPTNASSPDGGQPVTPVLGPPEFAAASVIGAPPQATPPELPPRDVQRGWGR